MKLWATVIICADGLPFPLFSQNGAENPSLQIHTGKQFGKDSTDSQRSLQQQGSIFLSMLKALAEKAWRCEFYFRFAEAVAKGISTVVDFILFEKASRVPA